MTTTLTRAGAALATAGLLVGMLSACTPDAEPTKTPKPAPSKTAIFDSDEEAFAAAEKTYREYNEAINARYRGENAADSSEYLVGVALEESLETRRTLDESGYKLVGQVPIVRLIPDAASVSDDRDRVEIVACLDLTKSRVVLANGEETDQPNRPETIATRAELTWVDDTFMVSRELDEENNVCEN